MAAAKNDNITAGPACCAATTPGKVKMDVDTIVPTPSAKKSLTPNTRCKCLSDAKYLSGEFFLMMRCHMPINFLQL